MNHSVRLRPGHNPAVGFVSALLAVILAIPVLAADPRPGNKDIYQWHYLKEKVLPISEIKKS